MQRPIAKLRSSRKERKRMQLIRELLINSARTSILNPPPFPCPRDRYCRVRYPQRIGRYPSITIELR
jgi:hypothetical protein